MNYLVIEGNIGVGKSSLVKMLSAEMSSRTIFEQFEDNPFLPKFYENPERYSFPLELSFLADRYKQHKTALSNLDMFAPLSIADYYFPKSLIFAGVTLEKDEYTLYRQLFDIIYQQIPVPDLYVYIHSPVHRLLENIELRGRDYEKKIEGSYLKKIQDGYFEYMKSRTDMKILIIDSEKIDFVNNEKDYVFIKNLIFNKEYEKGITRILEQY
ncbi:MAG: deoxynucleoside kinase [Bacteroidales bacterium]|nr:deoxynucleoside kinase [Bacteroidales bacterium]MCF8389245.1 deoxynucleoside kinase [Bacteroidales bacterium]